ncbi:MAG: DUF4982 domain-containing protein [Defluviitaleaceae bacterium]|nr:DUF4982 domain-containing protein [Defluviitaleaceae bacterium]
MTNRIKLKLNQYWQFHKGDAPGAHDIDFADNHWDTVHLPHTPLVEEVNVVHHFQGICWYRKHLALDSSYKGKKLYIEFEAAMQVAEVWVNGKHKLTHMGGYLPFIIDISDVDIDCENIIAVRLDNRDNSDIPPGKPLEKLDFSYFGGLYRNVWLHAVNNIHISNEIYANKIAGGGVFVRYEDVSEHSACVHVSTHVVNTGDKRETVTLETTLLDRAGVIVRENAGLTGVIEPGGEMAFSEVLHVKNPKLWHPDSPHLYTLKSEVSTHYSVSDTLDTSIGIRSIAFSRQDGFSINGKKLWIRGANRHQQYPYLGNAASDNAQYREAKLLKDAGFNFVRLGHYPQSPAFIDACDRLGLMAVEPTPGWQFCNEGIFKDIVLQNIRDMIRRDRNHPSIIMWEVSLNETGDTSDTKFGEWSGATDQFFRQCHEVAHEEYPGRQMFTCGDTLGRKDPEYVGLDIPFIGWNSATHFYDRDFLPDKPSFTREYGDWEFGGNHSTTRQVRENGEKALLVSAWNMQWTHNRTRGLGLVLGDSVWVGMDYNRGYSPTIPQCKSGVWDIFRRPKFSYYFYQSQVDATALKDAMVFIATYWAKETPKLVVYSNCEELELYVNGNLINRKKCDNGEDSDYKLNRKLSDPAYWMEQKGVEDQKAIPNDFINEMIDEDLYFDGGNCKHLAHAPFTFTNIPFERGKLTAIGYIDGKEVARDERITPEEALNICIDADTQDVALTADGSDFIFVHAKVIDKNGTIVPWDIHQITFKAEGDAHLIGENPVYTQGGIASIILQAALNPGTVKLSATAKGLNLGERIIYTV